MQQTTKINVHIIFQEAEYGVTLRAIESILAQSLVDNIEISVLLNGGTRPDIGAKLGLFPRINYYESYRNLGVAGGRNFLLRTKEAQSSDVIMFIDNDAIVPNDYVFELLNFLQAHPEAGLVGAVSLKYGSFKEHLEQIGISYTGYLGADIYGVRNSAVAKFLKAMPRTSFVDHIGTNKDYDFAYFSTAPNSEFLVSALDDDFKRTRFLSYSGDPTIVGKVLRGDLSFIEVSNIPGCCQAFRREVLDQVGYLNDLFNNYGFEDADFAIRLIKHGYRNYVNANCFMFHGTDARHKDRQSVKGQIWKIANESRARTILEFLHKNEDFPALSLQRLAQFAISRAFWAEKQSGTPCERSDELYFAVLGFQQAVGQLRHKYGDKFDQIVALGSERHGIDLGENALAAIPMPEGNKVVPDHTPISDLYNRSIKNAEERGRASALSTPAVISASSAFDFRSLQRFKGIHEGERCFIIGNGPSLRRTDFSWLKDEITFGVNGIFYMTDEIGFQPNYYTVEDNHVVFDNLERIKSVRAQAKFFPDKYREFLGDSNEIFYLPVDWSFYFKSSKFFEVPQFSEDVSEEIYVGQTVTYMNMQLAYYMGFRDVYLIGLDFSYEIPKTHPVEGFTITSMEDDPNHFHPEYFGKGKKWHFPKLHNCLRSYIHAGDYFATNGRRIYNATYGGRLECYDRVEYGSLFNGFVKLDQPNDRFTYRAHEVLKQYANTASNANPLVVTQLEGVRKDDIEMLMSAYLHRMPTTLAKSPAAEIALVDLAMLENESAPDLGSVFAAETVLLCGVSFSVESKNDLQSELLDHLQANFQSKDERLVWVSSDILLCTFSLRAPMGKLDPEVIEPGGTTQTDPVHLARHPEIVGPEHTVFVRTHVTSDGRWSEVYINLLQALSARHVPFLLTAHGVYA